MNRSHTHVTSLLTLALKNQRNKHNKLKVKYPEGMGDSQRTIIKRLYKETLVETYTDCQNEKIPVSPQK